MKCLMKPLSLASTLRDGDIINDEPLSASLKEMIDYMVNIIFIMRLSSSIFAGTCLVLSLAGSRLSPRSLSVTPTSVWVRHLKDIE